MIFGPMYRLVSPAGKRSRLSIFIFHRVVPQADPLLPDEPDAGQFETIVQFIKKNFHVLSLAAAVQRLATGNLPAAAACITFDDGYADNFSVAAPILMKHGLDATFFIASGFINGGRMWNDTVIEAVRKADAGELDWRDIGLGLHAVGDAQSRVTAYQQILGHLKYFDIEQRRELTEEIACRAKLPAHSRLMMTSEQVSGLHAMGMTIGGHTVTHPILAKLDESKARQEIQSGRAMLAEWTGVEPSLFAYPNGVPGRDYSSRDVELVRKSGFNAAVSTAWGVATGATNIFELPRFTPWDRSNWRFGLRCMANLLTS